MREQREYNSHHFFCGRSAYDLSQHTKATGVRLCAEKKLPEPITKSITEVIPNKGPIGKAFKKVP